jgi:four helix bundle protein
MAESIICDRAFVFSCRILALANTLWNRGPAARHIASQLMRCGTSIGSNAEEAQEGQTKRDFVAKLSVSRKEARETRY